MEVFLISLLQFLLAISLLVLLHELGHFTFAKIFKVRVNKFYLFFNPKFHIASTYDKWVRRLLKLKPEVVPTKEVEEEDKDGNKQKKTVKEYVGTEYGLGWLPLGGYCAIDGMIDETNTKLSEETHPWEFRTKPTWQRLLIMVGGVMVNFLLALFIYSMILFTWGETYVPVEKMTYGKGPGLPGRRCARQHRPRSAEEMGRRSVPRGIESQAGERATRRQALHYQYS